MALLLAAAGALSAYEVSAQGSPFPVPQATPQKPAVPATSARTSKAHAGKSAQAAEAPQKPAAPPTLEQQPPTPPQVTYRDGQLTIDSTNATLSQVLRSVQTQTGASVDMPPGAGSERVVATLGPGKPKDVLASLLNGSKFNYVILGASDNSGSVQKVILLAKSTSNETAAVSTAQNSVHAAPQPQGVEPPEDEYPQNEPEVENQNQLVPGQPGFPGGEQLTPDVINPGNRTPEQMLQELQRMQQQQQQMQQQLNPANRQQGPFPPQPAPIVPQPPN